MTIEVATSYDMMLDNVELTLLSLKELKRKSKHLRLGQLFINIATTGITWPELFHETNEDKATQIIREYMIRNQNPDFVMLMVQIQERKLVEQAKGH